MISKDLHLGDSEDVRSLELWAETHYNMALLQFDREDYRLAKQLTQDLIAHVQTEHRRGVQNQRSLAILKAAMGLQKTCEERK